MALPKINETIKYKTTIPSINKQVTFRPFLVKEEKVLLSAMEMKSKEALFNAIVDTIDACVYDDIDIMSLAIFDIEYLFLKIRAKSVGETVDMQIPCSECKHKHEHSLNVDDIKIEIPKKKNNFIQLNENIKLEMTYPKIKSLLISDMVRKEEFNQTEAVFSLILNCIEAVIVDDERTLLKDEPLEEQMKFIESFTTDQFEKVKNFIEQIPKLSEKIVFDCENCGHHNEIVLEGAQDFF